jgi:hypothetical protein
MHGKDLKGKIKDATPYSPKAAAFKLRAQETQVSVGVFQDSASTFPLHENC